MSYAGDGKGEKQTPNYYGYLKRNKKKSSASIAMVTGERSRNLEEMKTVKKAKLKSDIATLRKR